AGGDGGADGAGGDGGAAARLGLEAEGVAPPRDQSLLPRLRLGRGELRGAISAKWALLRTGGELPSLISTD
ncbi:hypothetical protein P5G65_02625, partial [Paenibacillus chondroitinus]